MASNPGPLDGIVENLLYLALERGLELGGVVDFPP